MSMHPIFLDLTHVLDRTVITARPTLCALLANDRDRSMPEEFAAFVRGMIGVQRQPDPVLEACATILYVEAKGDDAVRVEAAWRTVRAAREEVSQGAIVALYAFREMVRIVASHAPPRQVH
ncbi:MAG: hypothetical protein ROZ64_13630 [Burkholderiaceae bacterium]|nr:hypothetical protein [Burkholderiaceae bacterium]